MAVPKNRTSKSKTRSRKANWKLSAPAVSSCPQCHEPMLSHRVCPNCGYYNGKLVEAPKADKK